MDAKQKKLLEYMAGDITVKEEGDTDTENDFSTQIKKMHHGDEDFLFTSELHQNKILKTANDSVSQRDKQLKKIAFKDKKKSLARIMKKYPFLWDKNDQFHRNRQRREAAWLGIADELNTNVLEAKALWKKLKDTHRYLSSKGKKNIDFNPNDFCDDQRNENDILEDLSFLDDDYIGTAVRDAHTVNANSTFQPRKSLLDPLNIEDSNFDENPDSSFSFTDAKPEKGTQTTAVEASTVGQITSSNFEKKREDASDSNTLKHMHIWVQLEKLFEKLDDDKITDLNFLFVSETYKAILDKRKNQ